MIISKAHIKQPLIVVSKGTQVQDLLRDIGIDKDFVKQMQLNICVDLARKMVVIEKAY